MRHIADLQPKRGQHLRGQSNHLVPPHTHKFFCMSSRKDYEVPSLSYKETLTAARMGERKIVFPGKFNKPLLSSSTVYVFRRLLISFRFETLDIIDTLNIDVLLNLLLSE